MPKDKQTSPTPTQAVKDAAAEVVKEAQDAIKEAEEVPVEAEVKPKPKTKAKAKAKAKKAEDHEEGLPEVRHSDEVGGEIIQHLEDALLLMSPEVRRRQPELGHVFQLYQSEKPSIVERQKRLIDRRNKL